MIQTVKSSNKSKDILMSMPVAHIQFILLPLQDNEHKSQHLTQHFQVAIS